MALLLAAHDSEQSWDFEAINVSVQCPKLLCAWDVPILQRKEDRSGVLKGILITDKTRYRRKKRRVRFKIALNATKVMVAKDFSLKKLAQNKKFLEWWGKVRALPYSHQQLEQRGLTSRPYHNRGMGDVNGRSCLPVSLSVGCPRLTFVGPSHPGIAP